MARFDTQPARRFSLADELQPRLQLFRRFEQFDRAVVPLQFLLTEQGMHLSMARSTKQHSLFATTRLGHRMMLRELVAFVLVMAEDTFLGHVFPQS